MQNSFYTNRNISASPWAAVFLLKVSVQIHEYKDVKVVFIEGKSSFGLFRYKVLFKNSGRMTAISGKGVYSTFLPPEGHRLWN